MTPTSKVTKITQAKRTLKRTLKREVKRTLKRTKDPITHRKKTLLKQRLLQSATLPQTDRKSGSCQRYPSLPLVPGLTKK